MDGESVADNSRAFILESGRVVNFGDCKDGEVGFCFDSIKSILKSEPFAGCQRSGKAQHALTRPALQASVSCVVRRTKKAIV
jgi:hypothetical protein